MTLSKFGIICSLIFWMVLFIGITVYPENMHLINLGHFICFGFINYWAFKIIKKN